MITEAMLTMRKGFQKLDSEIFVPSTSGLFNIRPGNSTCLKAGLFTEEEEDA